MLAQTYRTHDRASPPLISASDSSINALKVVNPPQNPTASSNFASDDRGAPPPLDRPHTTPMIRHPAAFTANVPNGNADDTTPCTAFDNK